MDINLNGERMTNSASFHEEISIKLELGSFYGRNLDALWDYLTTEVERPIRLIWVNHLVSKKYMGKDEFNKIISTLNAVTKADLQMGLEGSFELILQWKVALYWGVHFLSFH